MNCPRSVPSGLGARQNVNQTRGRPDRASVVAIFEIDTDVKTARATLKAGQTDGSMTRPVGMQFDPPPSVRYFQAIDAP
jgi:hypothetical protein